LDKNLLMKEEPKETIIKDQREIIKIEAITRVTITITTDMEVEGIRTIIMEVGINNNIQVDMEEVMEIMEEEVVVMEIMDMVEETIIKEITKETEVVTTTTITTTITKKMIKDTEQPFDHTFYVIIRI